MITRLTLWCAAILVAIFMIWVILMQDVGATLRSQFPIVHVSIHHSTSPGFSFVPLFRLLRGSQFIPSTKSLDVVIKNALQPIDLGALLTYRVATLRIENSKIVNIAAIRDDVDSPFIEFINCEFPALTVTDRVLLRPSNSNENILVYGAP